jgi:hypothetical protein
MNQGHISDYHGYARKYDNFFSLRSGESIPEVRNEIFRILGNSTNTPVDETDEEILNECNLYEKATERYETLAKQERTKRNKNSEVLNVDNEEFNALKELPLVFASNMDEEVVHCNKHDKCQLCCSITGFPGLDESSLVAVPRFDKVVDEEDEDIEQLYADEFVEHSTTKRRSRTIQIAIQKKASANILNEMLNTFAFIEEYNNGFQGEKDEDNNCSCDEGNEGEDSEQEESGPDDISNADSNSKKQKAELIAIPASKDSISSKQNFNCEPSADVFKLSFVPLTHSSLLQQYKAMKITHRSFHPLKLNADIESTKEEILSFFSANGVLEDFFVDDEIVKEERAMMKGYRVYTRKADQERMEKREYEEKRQLELRRLEYYAKRKRKPSTHEIEWKDISSRPVNFIGRGKKLPAGVDSCQFGPLCRICAPILHADHPYERDEIFNPNFHKIEQDVSITNDGRAGTRSRNRAAERESEKISSALKLSEMFYTVEFIEKYNKGLIESTKK